jgi:hypothetical protein
LTPGGVEHIIRHHNKEHTMTLALLRPAEEDIIKVMQATGMDRMQAYRHVQARMFLQKVKNPYPLGRSAMDT